MRLDQLLGEGCEMVFLKRRAKKIVLGALVVTVGLVVSGFSMMAQEVTKDEGKKSKPAALYKCLGGFATNQVNMTKLESFSVKNTFDQVNFYLDFEGHLESKSSQKALEELGFHTEKLDILGVYEAHTFRFKNN